jgi:phage-related protein
MRKAISEQGLPAALTMLDDKLGGNREQLGKLLGSAEASSAAFQILDADAAAISGTFGEVAGAAGITQEAFDVTAQTTGFTLQQSLTELKTLLIEIGDIIAPFVQQVVERLQGLVAVFQNLSPAQKEMAVGFAAIAAAVGPVLLIVGKVISVVGGVIAVFNPLTLKIALVVGAVALLAAGFAYLWNNSETLRTTVMQVFEQIKSTVVGVIDLLKAKLEENRESIEAVKTAFAAIAQFIVEKVVPVVATFYGTYLQALITFLGLVVTAIIEFISFWVKVITKLVEVGVAITQFVAAGIANFTKFTDGVQTAFVTAFTAVRDFITGVFDTISSSIRETIKDAVNFVIGAINRVINAWNGLSFTIPQFTVGVGPAAVSFGPFGVGTPDLPNIPALAEGGIVRRPTLALIGEAGPEAVVPLRGGNAPGTTNISLTVNAGMGTDGRQVGRQIVEALRQYERSNGPVPIKVA